MKTAISLQYMLTKTAQEFEFDLNEAAIIYRLEDKSSNTITVKRENDNFLRVGEYKDYGDGKLTGDPEFLIFTGDAEWVPVGFGRWGSDFVWGALISSDGKELTSIIEQTQTEIAEKCEVWMRELTKRNEYDGMTGFLIPAWLT